MAICVKKIFICLLFLAISSVLSAKNSFSVINADGEDIAFREILIEKSMQGEVFNCTVTMDNLQSALQKLAEKKCDIITFKGKLPNSVKLPENIEYKHFASTPIIIAVHNSNPLTKLKISELRKIWNDDCNNWGYFNPKNFFSIHRFGMPLNDGNFIYLRNFLQLKENSQHFPLDSSQQILTMVSANPNAIGIAVMSENLNLKGVKLIQLTDENNRNIPFVIPHNIMFRKNDKSKIDNFIKIKK